MRAKSLIAILQIGLVAFCPYLCAEHCCLRAEHCCVSVCESHDEHGHQHLDEELSHNDHQPSNEHEDQHHGDCICSGAVIAQKSIPVFDEMQDWLSDIAFMQQQSAHLLSQSQLLNDRTAHEVALFLSGRVTCDRLCALLI